MQNERTVRVRFAPSPTGFLHVGGARTALFNWLIARQEGGKFVLRVEDTDEDRSTLESTQAILDGMSWLGLTWDEGPDPDPARFGESIGEHGPYYQSMRAPRHKELVSKLLAEGKAFYCPATTEEMTKPDGSKKLFSPYRDLSPEEQQQKLTEANGELAVRIKCPGDENGGPDITWNDMVRGEITVNCKEIGDFVIAKRNGNPLYNFAATCDDAEMQITHVLRGEDHTSNTPKQLLLYAALGFEPPVFGHMSLILGPDRAKLSKRHGATAVHLYKEAGYLPEAMNNFFAMIGWAPKDNREEFTLDELIDAFKPADIGKSGAMYNADKLDHFNATYIRKLGTAEFFERLRPFMPTEWVDTHGAEYATNVCALYQDKLTKLAEIEQNAWYFFRDPAEADYNEKTVAKFLTGFEPAAVIISRLYESFSGLSAEDWTEENLSAPVDALCEQLELGKGKVMQPWRVALTGDKISPGFYDLLVTLGRETVLRRAKPWVEKLGG